MDVRAAGGLLALVERFGVSPREVAVVGTRRAVAPVLEHLPRACHAFADVRRNPTLSSVVRCADALVDASTGVVVAVGGGSAMDTAKAARALVGPDGHHLGATALRIAPRGAAPPLIVLPTTAGSGSEVTPFATVFHGRRKMPFDHPSLLPDDFLRIDPLLATCPPDVRTAAGLDAAAHALESAWSLAATSADRAEALSTLRDIVPVLLDGVRMTWPPGSRRRLAEGATRAGQCIARTRTTAGHAFAYGLTLGWGVPHGVAVMLALRWLVPLTLAADEGLAGVLTAALSGAGPDGTIGLVELPAALLRANGWDPRLRAYGVPADALEGIVEGALGVTTRVGNHPVKLTADACLAAIRGAW